MPDNPQLKLAEQFVEFTNKNIFLTGKAGTGKTTFLQKLKKKSSKRSVVVAPTGVAAINAGGVTIHSFFQMPFGPKLPKDVSGENNSSAAGYTRLSKNKINIIRSLDLLIIDEISMVRADLLDGIDEVLRRYRRTSKPFGGVQLLMIGDIQQLSPIVKDNERQLLQPYYDTFYFYGSRALKKTDYISIELKHIYRQNDSEFIDLLNGIRENRLDEKGFNKLNQRYQPGFTTDGKSGYIVLTTHNYKAQEINQIRLESLKTKLFTFIAHINGDFPEYIYPTEPELKLKVGAQVMFIKNDPSPDKQYYNGKIGVIDRIDSENEGIVVKCTEDNQFIEVARTEWQNCSYSLNEVSMEIEEEVVGTFMQFPLKLAWAITIHKSQGLTFDKAIIDAHDSFAHGQVYVAFSRCRSLEGMVLKTPVARTSIKTDTEVYLFSKNVEENPPDEQIFKRAKNDFTRELVLELFDFSQIHISLLTLMKVARENRASLLIDILPVIQEIVNVLRKEVIEVTDKFNRQLEQLLSSNDKESQVYLQERIAKASVYFSDKTKNIIDKTSNISIETDNKQVNKQLSNVTDRLVPELHIKYKCLEECKQGFHLKGFLDTRARAAIEKSGRSKPEKQEKLISLTNISHPGLFEKLRSWRNNEALARNIPVYQIVSQRALMGITAALPSSADELFAIKGIGRRKITTYGISILKIVSEYCASENIAYKTNFDLVFSEKKKRDNVPDTKRTSLELFRENKSIEEIAAERNLAVTTIEGHLAHFVQTGELPVDHLLSEEEINEIADAIKKTDDHRLTNLKELLNHKYDYGKLKMAVAWYRSKTG